MRPLESDLDPGVITPARTGSVVLGASPLREFPKRDGPSYLLSGAAAERSIELRERRQRPQSAKSMSSTARKEQRAKLHGDFLNYIDSIVQSQVKPPDLPATTDDNVQLGGSNLTQGFAERPSTAWSVGSCSSKESWTMKVDPDDIDDGRDTCSRIMGHRLCESMQGKGGTMTMPGILGFILPQYDEHGNSQIPLTPTSERGSVTARTSSTVNSTSRQRAAAEESRKIFNPSSPSARSARPPRPQSAPLSRKSSASVRPGTPTSTNKSDASTTLRSARSPLIQSTARTKNSTPSVRPMSASTIRSSSSKDRRASVRSSAKTKRRNGSVKGGHASTIQHSNLSANWKPWEAVSSEIALEEERKKTASIRAQLRMLTAELGSEKSRAAKLEGMLNNEIDRSRSRASDRGGATDSPTDDVVLEEENYHRDISSAGQAVQDIKASMITTSKNPTLSRARQQNFEEDSPSSHVKVEVTVPSHIPKSTPQDFHEEMDMVEILSGRSSSSKRRSPRPPKDNVSAHNNSSVTSSKPLHWKNSNVMRSAPTPQSRAQTAKPKVAKVKAPVAEKKKKTIIVSGPPNSSIESIQVNSVEHSAEGAPPASSVHLTRNVWDLQANASGMYNGRSTTRPKKIQFFLRGKTPEKSVKAPFTQHTSVG